MSHLIVFSHLRWSFVYQRPQHLLSRLAGRYQILFIEEPVFDDTGPARFERTVHDNGLEVLVPRTSVAAPGFHDDQLAVLQTLVAQELAQRKIRDYLVWLYTPMALPLATDLQPRALVYDCMDELAAFDHAPRQLRQREHMLMQTADLVLTGGPALFDAKRALNPNVHCLPSAVDAEHFSLAGLRIHSDEASAVRALQDPIPHPRLGFFGVIDERMDLALVGELAARQPDWQFVMIGPVVKIDPASLPRGANIHWLGMQSYQRLPYFLADWDICLMPFAMNDATRFISPTKTLEYMAAEKPVVSTPVPDVVRLYGNAVSIASDATGFARACSELLSETKPRREQRLRRMKEAVAAFSWDRSASTVSRLLEEAAHPRTAAPVKALRSDDSETLLDRVG